MVLEIVGRVETEGGRSEWTRSEGKEVRHVTLCDSRREMRKIQRQRWRPSHSKDGDYQLSAE